MTKPRLPIILIRGIVLIICTFVGPSLRWALVQTSSTPDARATESDAILPVMPSLHNHSLPERREFDENELKDSFSSCLLVMDDNHRLTEWVAYHYYTARLRYLIIGVDPRSKTSPMDVLWKWEPYMKIIVWDDDHFVPEHRRTLAGNATMDEKTSLMKLRQTFFLSACATAMKNAKRTYVTVIDPDEYLTFNRPEGMTLPSDAPEDMRSTVAPSVKEEGSILRILQEARDNHPNSTLGAPCLPTYRVLFNAKESTEEERNVHVPSGFNAMQFDTLRYRYRMRDAIARNEFTQLGKSILDVSRIRPRHLKSPRRHFPNPHQILFPDYCWNVHTLRYQNSFFRINHYLGSWESYNARDDARNSGDWRNKETWEKKTLKMKDTVDDGTIRPWLEGFVQQHGEAQAMYLLQDAGIIPTKDS